MSTRWYPHRSQPKDSSCGGLVQAQIEDRIDLLERRNRVVRDLMNL